jgi:iron(III) transport system ATP-binding protein
MSDGQTILRVRGAERHFGPDLPALNGADLDLHAGRITALLGPSGSGKSTLLRAIAGLERLDAGQITCLDQAWDDGAEHLAPEKRRAGMVFQDYALFPHMTALANIAFGLSGGDKNKRAQAQLAAVELGHKAGAYPHELSGGEQQRIALARALAPSPAIMLLDEPFSGLDRRLRRDLRDQTVQILRSARTAALIVTHDADEAFAVADELALMESGRIVQCGAPDAVWLDPVSASAARLVGDVDVCGGIVRKGGVETPLGRVEAGSHVEGSAVDVLIRPEAISLSADAGGTLVVQHARPLGARIQLVVRAADGSQWTAQTLSPSPIGEGDKVSVTLNARFVRVVAAP